MQRDYDTRIEAVIVSVNYGDLLAQTLPLNLPHLDRVVVVTDPNDTETRNVAKRWGARCIPTEIMGEDGQAFNKGAGVNLGITFLKQKGWILQLDADIVLPLSFRNMLFKSALREDCLYGVERACVTGWEQWRRVREQMLTVPQYSDQLFVDTPAETPISANLVHKHHGYLPLGFFQLFHASYLHYHGLHYPDHVDGAEMSDLQFSLLWPRINRILLPTVRVFHLESEKAAMGANWGGRTTRRFGPAAETSETNSYHGYAI